MALLNVGNFAGRLVAGPLSDHVGRRTALHVDATLLVLACIPLAAGATGPLALVALLVLGLQYGALSALTPAATADVVPGSGSAAATDWCSPGGASPGCSPR